MELLRKRPAKTRANAESGTPSGYPPGIGGGSGAEATAAVVETLSVAVDVPLPGVTLAGVNAQLVCAGSPELFVRSVKLVKNTILPETKMPKSVAVR